MRRVGICPKVLVLLRITSKVEDLDPAIKLGPLPVREGAIRVVLEVETLVLLSKINNTKISMLKRISKRELDQLLLRSVKSL